MFAMAPNIPLSCERAFGDGIPQCRDHIIARPHPCSECSDGQHRVRCTDGTSMTTRRVHRVLHAAASRPRKCRGGPPPTAAEDCPRHAVNLLLTLYRNCNIPSHGGPGPLPPRQSRLHHGPRRHKARRSALAAGHCLEPWELRAQTSPTPWIFFAESLHPAELLSSRAESWSWTKWKGRWNSRKNQQAVAHFD